MTTFPPTGPTVLTQTIPAYVYQQYADDDSIQALNTAFNQIAQAYVTWFATIGLPIYTGAAISGALLDWVANGLYGYARPVFTTGRTREAGPPNTFTPNQLPPNTRKRVGSQTFFAASDDVYKRCLTWNFYKGDGRTFSVRWLKRRVMRWLIGTAGTAPPIDQTYQISVTFGIGNQVNIRLIEGVRSVSRGMRPGYFAPNTRTPNGFATTHSSLAPIPNAAAFKIAADSGALQFPFQFVFNTVIQT